MKFQLRTMFSIIVLSTIFVSASYSQRSLNGFLNIPFGTNMETAKKLLLQKPGVKFIGQNEQNNLCFSGFVMGAFASDTCILSMSPSNGRFETSSLFFRYQTTSFGVIFEQIRTQYGNPTKTYSKNNATIYRWEFPVRCSKSKNSITLQDVPSGDYFTLRYDGTGMLHSGWLQYYSQNKK